MPDLCTSSPSQSGIEPSRITIATPAENGVLETHPLAGACRVPSGARALTGSFSMSSRPEVRQLASTRRHARGNPTTWTLRPRRARRRAEQSKPTAGAAHSLAARPRPPAWFTLPEGGRGYPKALASHPVPGFHVLLGGRQNNPGKHLDLVGKEGVEPSRPKTHGPEPCASTSFATRPWCPVFFGGPGTP